MSVVKKRNKIFYMLIILFLINLFNIKLLLLNNMGIQGYHVNLYKQIGNTFLLLTIIIHLIGVWTLFRCLCKKRKIIILMTVILLLSNYISFLVAPWFLGYYTIDRGDNLSSIGFLNSILKTGKMDSLDISSIYPSTFIFITSLKLISGTSVSNIIWLTPIIYFIFFVILLIILGNYFLRKIFFNKNLEYSIKVFSIITGISFGYILGYYHDTIVANYTTFVIEGIVIYTFFKYIENYSNKYLILFILFFASTVIGHPFIAFFNVYLFILYFVYFKLKFQKKPKTTMIIAIATIFILPMAWLVFQPSLLKTVIKIFQFVIFSKYTVIDQTLLLTKRAKLSIFEIIKYSSVMFSAQILLYSSILIILLILLILKMKPNLKNTKILPILSKKFFKVGFFGFSITSIFTLFLLFSPIKRNYNKILYLNIGIYFAIVLFIILFFNLLYHSNTKKQQKRWIFLFLILISTIFITSVFGLFYSPYTGLPNIGISNSEMSGINFLFPHLCDSCKVIDPIGESGRYFIWRYGYSSALHNPSIMYMTKIPDHFGYFEVRYVGELDYAIKIQHNIFSYQKKVKMDYNNTLIVISKYHIEPYEIVTPYRNVARYTFNDLMRLRSDTTVNMIYSTNDFKISYVYS